MKKSLGKIFLLLTLLLSYADAQELAKYTLKADKTTAYEKEAVTIKFEATQLDHTDNMMFLLKPRKSSDYKIILLNKSINDKEYHHSHTTFTYLLFPLKAKTINVSFDFTIQSASDQSIANSFVDDHDDSIAIQTRNTKMAMTPLQINVKKLAHKVDLVGNFQLTEEIDKENINQYESVNLVYTLEGRGYEEQNLKLLQNIEGVTLFSEVNNITSKATKNGFAIKREYIYALSAKKDFTIKPRTLKVFSPTSKRYYTLKVAQHSIKVTPIDTTKLLDKEDAPSTKPFIEFATLKTFFIYLMLFITGVFTGIMFKQENLFRFKKKDISKEVRTIQKAKDEKELLFILMQLGLEKEFTQEIRLLEGIVYKNIKANFDTIKQNILKELK